MDFPISVPGIGLVDGKFIDEDALSGTPGSLIPSVWGNSITLEILNVIEGAGLTPDEDNNTQLLQAINSILSAATPEATETVLGLIRRSTQAELGEGTNDTAAVSPKKLATAVQNQTLTAFTTAGVAPAFTLTPSPAIDAYAPSQRFNVKFNAAAPTSGTLNVSGKGEKNLKQYDSTGTKIATVIAANQVTDVVYDGTDFVVLDPLPCASGLQGSARGLAASATGLSALASYTIDEVVTGDGAGNCQSTRAWSAAISTSAASGPGGIDTGTVAASTWYYTFAITKPDGSKALIYSLSSTSPSLANASGYTKWARVGVFRTDGTANKFPLAFKQSGRRFQYAIAAGTNLTAYPSMGSTTAVLTNSPIAWANFAPPTAASLYPQIISTPGTAPHAYTIIAPSAGVSAFEALSATPSTAASTVASLIPDGPNLFFTFFMPSGTGSGSIAMTGWEDNL